MGGGAEGALLLQALPALIPCGDCKQEARKYLDANAGSNRQRGQITQQTMPYFEFFVGMHNAVNRRNGKPVMSLEAAYLEVSKKKT